MSLSPETKVLTAHVPVQLAQKVDLLAARFERSRGWIMKQALEAWVDQEEDQDLMRLKWTESVLSDLTRLYDLLFPLNTERGGRA
jgi:predicted DNA-binding protein